ncbi:MAG: molybdopterin-dependent oxidoreductase [Pseudomonadota bacterium]
MLKMITTTATASAFFLAAPALANDTVLTVSGAVAASDSGETWTFDMDDLTAMPSESFETNTIWTEGVQTFEGVSLSVLLEFVGADGAELNAVALNDYAVSIPTKDAVEGGPIIAYSQNGAEMSVRNKGPLWIVYPYDGNETYKSEEYYSRSIWQLDRIEVVAGN